MTGILQKIIAVRLSAQAVGLDDDFYAIGGDSLTALQVVADAQDRGILITLHDLLYNPTVRELAAVLARSGPPSVGAGKRPPLPPFGLLSEADRALIPAGVSDVIPASSLQVGIIYLCEASRDPRLYVNLVGWNVATPLDEPLFEEAFGELCQRHVALRSSFDLGTFSIPVQMIASGPKPALSTEWVDEGAAGTTSQAVSRWQEQLTAESFGWNTPPLVRCHVVAEPRSFHVILAAHHAIIDGWSYGRLVADLLTLYAARLRGEAAPLPPIQAAGYREAARAEREVLASPEAAAFWRTQADAPRVLFAPNAPGSTANACASIAFPMPDSLTQDLRRVARELCVPLKSLALAAHSWALGTCAGRLEDLVTGVVVNTRSETSGPDLMVGPYLNTVPLRFDSLCSTWADLAMSAFDAERETSQYRAYPLAQIEENLGRPAFDAVFNYMNFHVYQEVDSLPEITAQSWVMAGKPSFPFRVDFEVAGPEAGGRVVIEFDPVLLAAEQAGRYAELFREALAAAAADPDAVAGPGAGRKAEDRT